MNGPPGPRPHRPESGEQGQRRPGRHHDVAAADTRPAPALGPRPRRQPPPGPAHRYGQTSGYRPPPRTTAPPSNHLPARPPPHSTAAPRAEAAAQQDQQTAPAGKKTLHRVVIGAAVLTIVIASAVLVSGVSRLLNTAGGKVLDVDKVQDGVLQTLTDPAGGYGANTVSGVSCNNGRNPRADKRTTFTCDVVINGAERHVTVVVSDDNGTYEVDRPR